MPYNSATGVYTPPTGAENAVAGGVIHSATWNSIFTDIALALTQVGQMNWVQEPKIASSGSFSVAPTINAVFVTVSAPTITLAPASLQESPLTIIGDGNASIFASHNSVIVPVGSDTINGGTSFTLTTNNQVAIFYPLSGTGYMVK